MTRTSRTPTTPPAAAPAAATARKPARRPRRRRLVLPQLAVCVRCREPFLAPASTTPACSSCRPAHRADLARAARQRARDRLRTDVHARDNGCCYLSGHRVAGPGENLRDWQPTLDHVRPRARGGRDARTNLRLAHALCNEAKGAQCRPEEIAARVAAALRRRPVPVELRTPGIHLVPRTPGSSPDPDADTDR